MCDSNSVVDVDYLPLRDPYIESLAEKLGVDYGCAEDVMYLRTRGRWTQGLEDLLIRLHQDGNPPNIYEF